MTITALYTYNYNRSGNPNQSNKPVFIFLALERIIISCYNLKKPAEVLQCLEKKSKSK